MSDRDLEGLLLSPAVANALGVKTSTLAKWRSLGIDPAGAIWLSPTTVAYPRESVRRWLEDRRDHPKKRGRPPKSHPKEPALIPSERTEESS